MSGKFSSLVRYYCTLVSFGALIIISRAVRLTALWQGDYWIDVVANYALLGLIGAIAALGGAILFVKVESAFSQSKYYGLAKIPTGIIFTVVIAAWFNCLLLLMTVFNLKLVSVSNHTLGLGILPICGLLFIVFNSQLSVWVHELNQFLRIPGLIVTIVVILLSLYVFLSPANQPVAEGSTVARENQSQPNVIIIVLDALTSRDMSLYNYNIDTTPNLTRLTREWTVYENAHSTSTVTFGVMPSILMGRYPYFDQWYRYGDLARTNSSWLTLPHILKSLGYETVYFMGGGYTPSKYHLHADFDRILGGGFMESSNFGLSCSFPGRNLLNSTVWNSEFLSTLPGGFYGLCGSSELPSEPMYPVAEGYFLEKSRDLARPFFVYLHMNRPHFPYIGNEYLGTILPIEDGLADITSQTRFGGPYAFIQQPEIDRLRLRYGCVSFELK